MDDREAAHLRACSFLKFEASASVACIATVVLLRSLFDEVAASLIEL
jgi:hypothetical protein